LVVEAGIVAVIKSGRPVIGLFYSLVVFTRLSPNNWGINYWYSNL